MPARQAAGPTGDACEQRCKRGASNMFYIKFVWDTFDIIRLSSYNARKMKTIELIKPGAECRTGALFERAGAFLRFALAVK